VQLSRTDVPGEPDRVRYPDLPDQDPVLILVRDRAPLAVDLVHVISV
jgi:hypothetical protein